MRKSLALLGACSLAALALVGCGGDDDDNDAAAASSSPTSQSASSDKSLEAVLTEAVNEEYKAHATYQAVIDKFGSVQPFANIVNSEQQHIDAWKKLFTANNLAVPADTFLGKVTVPASIAEACQVGVAAEKEDVALYVRLATETTDAEALKVMEQQKKVSQENHLPAFEKC